MNATFDDPAPPGSPGSYVNGVIEGVNFGTNQWRWWSAYGGSPTNHLYFSSATGTSRTFSFANGPRTLTSLQLSTTMNGTLTLTDERGQRHSQNLATGNLYTVPTGWTQPSTTVTVSFSAGWALNVDEITHRCP